MPKYRVILSQEVEANDEQNAEEKTLYNLRNSYLENPPDIEVEKVLNDIEIPFEWTRVNSDINGNPRHVVHFLELIRVLKHFDKWTDNPSPFHRLKGDYEYICKLANKLGGRKFHNKQYGGGIVFQTYSTDCTEKFIKENLHKHVK